MQTIYRIPSRFLSKKLFCECMCVCVWACVCLIFKLYAFNNTINHTKTATTITTKILAQFKVNVFVISLAVTSTQSGSLAISWPTFFQHSCCCEFWFFFQTTSQATNSTYCCSSVYQPDWLAGCLLVSQSFV